MGKNILPKVTLTGDYIDLKIDGQNIIIIHINELIDEDDSWYWSEEWQQMEREADEDLKTSRTKTFNHAEDLIRELKE